MRLRRSLALLALCTLLAALAAPTLAAAETAATVETDTAAEVRLAPGSLLFPLKLFWERVQVFLSFSPEARAELLARQAETRLQELHLLIAAGRSELAERGAALASTALVRARLALEELKDETRAEIRARAEARIAAAANALAEASVRAEAKAGDALTQALEQLEQHLTAINVRSKLRLRLGGGE